MYSTHPHFLTVPHSAQLQNDISRGPEPQKSQYHPTSEPCERADLVRVFVFDVIENGREVVHASHDWLVSGLRRVQVGHDHSSSVVRSITSGLGFGFVPARTRVGRDDEAEEVELELVVD